MKTKIFSLFACALALSAQTAFAVIGTESGGGGNGYAAEFVRLASFGLDSLARQGDEVINSQRVDLSAMGRALLTANIQFTKQDLILNGKRVHAINEPAKGLITVNETSWKSLDDSTKMQLAFHELWGLSFHDHKDDSYVFSTAMVARIRDAGFTNPSKVIALLTNNQNGRGQTFRAILVRQGAETRSNLSVIFQKLQQVNDTLDIITSNVVYKPSELPYGADTVVQNLRLSYDNDGEAFVFEVEPMTTLAPKLTCKFVLPEPPATEELSKQNLNCVVTK